MLTPIVGWTRANSYCRLDEYGPGPALEHFHLDTAMSFLDLDGIAIIAHLPTSKQDRVRDVMSMAILNTFLGPDQATR